ncbi:MAG: hypothetical protein V3V41_00930 [Candidatus Heimdallarchaeota archaeon]
MPREKSLDFSQIRRHLDALIRAEERLNQKLEILLVDSRYKITGQVIHTG